MTQRAAGASGGSVGPRPWRSWLSSIPPVTKALALVAMGLAVTTIAVSCRTSEPGDPLEPTGNEPDVRVRLIADAASVSVRPLDAGDAIELVSAGRTLATGPRGGAVMVGVSGGGLTATDERGRRLARVGVDEPLGLRSTGTTGVDVEGRPLRGRVVAVASGGSGVSVVASLPMERYLAGVLNRELVTTWSLAAFQAQAVAARSYALHERAIARRSSRVWDLESTTADQVFGGDTELAVAIEAARSTRGVVLTHGGEVVRAYYHSTCGDRAASAVSVWGGASTGEPYNEVPPLQATSRACACEASPLHRWEVTRSSDDVVARLRAWGESRSHPVGRVRDVRSISVATTNAVGRPERYRVASSQGTFELSGEELRRALNTDVSGYPSVTRETRIPSNDFEAVVSSGRVRLGGAGFGHGVGLCQWGAEGLSRRGMGWRQIVLNYYPGASLSEVY